MLPAAAPTLPVIELANLTTLPDGRRVEWEAIGSGPPLIWVEGGPGFPAHLARPDVRLLARWFRCHLVNAPGCGRTSPPEDPLAGYSLDAHVGFFESVRAALGLDRVTLAGHSWGGLVASAWAGMHLESVDRLIVFDGYAGGGSVDEAAAEAEREFCFDRLRDRPWFADALAALERILSLERATEAELVAGFHDAWPLYFHEPDSPVARAHIERIRREIRWNADVADVWDREYEALDYRPTIADVRCPTLILVGEHDFVCGPVWNHALAEVIPGASYVEVAEAGHVPQYEQPEVVIAAIEAWLDRFPLAPVP